MQYVPYGRLLTIDQANAVYMEAERQRRRAKKWLTIQCIALIIGFLATLITSDFGILLIVNTISYFIGLCLTGMPRVTQFLFGLFFWLFVPPFHTLISMSALSKQKKDCVKFLQANGL